MVSSFYYSLELGLSQSVTATSAAKVGVLCAIAAYSMWGVAPLYFKQLAMIPAAEILMHRVIWSALLLFVLIFGLKQWPKVFAAVKNRKVMQVLFVAAGSSPPRPAHSTSWEWGRVGALLGGPSTGKRMLPCYTRDLHCMTH